LLVNGGGTDDKKSRETSEETFPKEGKRSGEKGGETLQAEETQEAREEGVSTCRTCRTCQAWTNRKTGRPETQA